MVEGRSRQVPAPRVRASGPAAHDGAEMRVLDRHDDWVQVEDGSGKIGWFNKKQVDVLPGA